MVSPSLALSLQLCLASPTSRFALVRDARQSSAAFLLGRNTGRERCGHVCALSGPWPQGGGWLVGAGSWWRGPPQPQWQQQGPVPKNMEKGHLTGSVRAAGDSLSWGCEFEPRIGCGDYLEIKSKTNPKYAGWLVGLQAEPKSLAQVSNAFRSRKNPRAQRTPGPGLSLAVDAMGLRHLWPTWRVKMTRWSGI